jgi:hypothetical protein
MDLFVLAEENNRGEYPRKYTSCRNQDAINLRQHLVIEAFMKVYFSQAYYQPWMRQLNESRKSPNTNASISQWRRLVTF